MAGEYVGSARGQDHQWLQQSSGGDADAAANPHQDSSAMRLFLFDCTDGAKSSSKIMLRLRRSISALAPDIALGVVAVYCNIHAPRLPPPVMDVDKVCPSPPAVFPSTVASRLPAHVRHRLARHADVMPRFRFEPCYLNYSSRRRQPLAHHLPPSSFIHKHIASWNTCKCVAPRHLFLISRLNSSFFAP